MVGFRESSPEKRQFQGPDAYDVSLGITPEHFPSDQPTSMLFGDDSDTYSAVDGIAAPTRVETVDFDGPSAGKLVVESYLVVGPGLEKLGFLLLYLE